MYSGGVLRPSVRTATWKTDVEDMFVTLKEDFTSTTVSSGYGIYAHISMELSSLIYVQIAAMDTIRSDFGRPGHVKSNFCKFSYCLRIVVCV
jgi:hypothetical protein